MMKININEKPNRSFNLSIEGNIDGDTYQEFKDTMQDVERKGAKTILLDFRDVDYVSSIGFGVIFGLTARLKAKGGQVLFANLKPSVKKIFEIVKALPQEGVFSSVEEADRYIRKSSDPSR